MKRAFCISVLLSISFCARAEFPVSLAAGEQTNPAIYETIIVWQDNRNGNWDIYGYDLKTEKEFVICSNSASQTDPDIYGNYVVWRDTRGSTVDIWGYNLNTKQEFAVTTATSTQEEPAIGTYGGDIVVVWTDSRDSAASGKNIYGYDITKGSSLTISKASSDQTNPDIYNGVVVWQDSRNFAASSYDIYGSNLNTQTSLTICTQNYAQRQPRIYGSKVVWYDVRNNIDYDIYGYDVDTKTEFDICIHEGSQKNPDIYGDLVCWQDERSGLAQIYVYDLVTKQEKLIAGSSASRENPAAGAGLVSWQDARSGVYDLYAYEPKSTAEFEYAAEIDIGVVSGSTSDAFGMDVTAGGYNDYRDEWYLFVPSVGGDYVISLCGSSFDTTLAVFDEYLVEIVFNDDYCGLQSQALLKASAMKPYYIRVAGYNGSRGDYALEVIKITLGGGYLTKLPDSSYLQGIAQFGFLIYPETGGDPEAVLSGEIEYAVYDTMQYPGEFPYSFPPGSGRYIYAYQIFNGSENFLGLPQIELGHFMLHGPTPADPNIGSIEDPTVYLLPPGEMLGPGTAPTGYSREWANSWWDFANPVMPGQWSWFLLMQSDLDYAVCDAFKVNDRVKSGLLPAPANAQRDLADFIENGTVGMEDFAFWAEQFMTESNAPVLKGDFDCDGKVGLMDLEEFACRWMWSR